MKKIAMMLTFSLVFLSCEKNKQLIVENADIPLISKVLTGGVMNMEYSYNGSNLLTEEKSKFTYIRHSYNENNLLSSSDFYMDPGMFSSDWSVVEASMNRKEWVNPDNTPKSLTQSFEYNNNEELTRITYIRPSNNNSEYSEFTYENNRINRQNIYWQNIMSYYIDYLYDEKGNLVIETKYHVPSPGVADLWTTTEYEYDNLRNPFQTFKRLMTPGKNTNPNNITKETYTIHFHVDQLTQNIQVINYTYLYNDNGYPIKVNGEAEYIYQ